MKRERLLKRQKDKAGAMENLYLLVYKYFSEYTHLQMRGLQHFWIKTPKGDTLLIDKNLEKYYHLIGFLDEEKLKHVYRATDFIISRSGASAIFEIAALGKPSILVPLPTAAADHQAKNAYAYAETGATLVIEQDNLTPNFFMEKMQSLFLRKEAIEKMKERAIEFSKPLAAKAVAREILEFLMLN